MPPIHLVETLREDFLGPLGLSVNRLAIKLQTTVTRMNDIVRGKRAITADTALRLGDLLRNHAPILDESSSQLRTGAGSGRERGGNRRPDQAIPSGVTRA